MQSMNPALSLPSTKRQISKPSTSSKRDYEFSRQRNKLYERIIVTETEYEKYLSKILSYVVEPMRVARTTPKHFEKLVGTFTKVLESNSKILQYIHQRVATRPSQVISGVFIEHVGTLHSYIRYYKHFPELLATARKCLGDMRTLGADATFVGATLPVILFRPVLRVFEYEFFLRQLLHFTDAAHQFHGYFQKAHTHVMTVLRELEGVIDQDVAHKVNVLRKVCGELNMPMLILPGRRYHSTWKVQRCCVGAASCMFALCCVRKTLMRTAGHSSSGKEAKEALQCAVRDCCYFT